MIRLPRSVLRLILSTRLKASSVLPSRWTSSVLWISAAIAESVIVSDSRYADRAPRTTHVPARDARRQLPTRRRLPSKIDELWQRKLQHPKELSRLKLMARLIFHQPSTMLLCL